MTTVWIDGAVTTDLQARISPLDHGLTVGDGVFETLKAVDGEPFALTRHLRRLRRSAEVLGLVVPPDGLLRGAVGEVLAAEPELTFARVRITLTAGAGPLGSDRHDVAPTLIVAVQATHTWARPVRVVTVPWTRNERSAVAGAKTTSYAENVVALRYAHERGAAEALLANTRGDLCEGTGSNVVVSLGGELVTPPLSSGCLAGITRELLLEWAEQEGLKIVERDLRLHELADAEDVMITSSTRDVQHVDELDGRAVPTSEAGRLAVELFARRAAERSDP